MRSNFVGNYCYIKRNLFYGIFIVCVLTSIRVGSFEMALNRAIFIIAFGSLLIHSIDCSLKNCKSELKGDVTNKVVLITGGNSGIGLETVKQLAFRGATVIMACRNKDKANAEIGAFFFSFIKSVSFRKFVSNDRKYFHF